MASAAGASSAFLPTAAKATSAAAGSSPVPFLQRNDSFGASAGNQLMIARVIERAAPPVGSSALHTPPRVRARNPPPHTAKSPQRHADRPGGEKLQRLLEERQSLLEDRAA